MLLLATILEKEIRPQPSSLPIGEPHIAFGELARIANLGT